LIDKSYPLRAGGCGVQIIEEPRGVGKVVVTP